MIPKVGKTRVNRLYSLTKNRQRMIIYHYFIRICQHGPLAWTVRRAAKKLLHAFYRLPLQGTICLNLKSEQHRYPGIHKLRQMYGNVFLLCIYDICMYVCMYSTLIFDTHHNDCTQIIEHNISNNQAVLKRNNNLLLSKIL